MAVTLSPSVGLGLMREEANLISSALRTRAEALGVYAPGLTRRQLDEKIEQAEWNIELTKLSAKGFTLTAKVDYKHHKNCEIIRYNQYAKTVSIRPPGKRAITVRTISLLALGKPTQ